MRPLLQTCRLCCHMTGIRCNCRKFRHVRTILFKASIVATDRWPAIIISHPRRTLRMRMRPAVKPGADCLLAVKVDPASLSTGRDVERIKHGLQKRLARAHSCLSLSRAAFAATLAGWRLSMEFRLWPSRKVTRLRRGARSISSGSSRAMSSISQIKVGLRYSFVSLMDNCESFANDPKGC